MIHNKKILIFGGTGSLGKHFIKKYIESNEIYVYSRDENKHWKMKNTFQHSKLKFIIGDICNLNKVSLAIKRCKPDIILIFSAMKHVDICERNTQECIKTNIIGIKNIINSIEMYQIELNNLKKVLFVSTDKACQPTNIYGSCKMISESLMNEASSIINNIKFINIRYGNVLNSSGSIIPVLHSAGQNEKCEHFILTHNDMTRFIMTLDDAINLIEYALNNTETGDTIVYPGLFSMRIRDLMEIFSGIYKKSFKIGRIRPGEKIHECLISKIQSRRTIKKSKYYHIKNHLIHDTYNEETFSVYSNDKLLNITELKEFLITEKLI